MLAFSLFASALGSTQEPETYWTLWNEYRASGKRWLPEILSAEEHNSRFEIFKDAVDKITEHNAKGLSWKMGITSFTDMTPEEFKTKVVGSYCNEEFQANAKLNFAKTKVTEGRRRKVVETGVSMVDWTAEGKVTNVKNQQSCGSCWAFSTTGSIEGRTAIADNAAPVSLSEQELVDCDTVDSGCNGGAMQNGFNYAQENNGLCTELTYAYTATDGTCKSSTCTHVSPVSGYKTVSYGESYLETAVTAGPVSIAIEADQTAFQYYTSGVFSGDCGTSLDHGVLVVGFNNDSSDGAYWIVKNSWGTGWGESGYMRMCKDCDKNSGAGQCGLAEDASYPTI